MKKLDRDRIYRMWEEGYSIDAITQEVGSRSPGHIREIIQKKYGRIDPLFIDRGKIFALRKAGWTVTKIAEEMKLPNQEIVNILKEVTHASYI